VISGHVQYVGFTDRGAGREYRLLFQLAGSEPREFIVVIPNEAFLARRVRYQDGPEICFLRLQRDLAAGEEGPASAQLQISDADLEAYRTAHTPKPPQRRAKPKPQPA